MIHNCSSLRRLSSHNLVFTSVRRNLIQMGYSRDHIFMAVQAVLYMSCATAAFIALIPIGVVKASFRDHCMLYGEVTFTSTGSFAVSSWGRDSTCSYICWINALVLIAGVFFGAYFIAMCCTGREAFGLEAACCAPFPIQIIVHIVFTFLTFLAACLSSAGLRHLCASIKIQSQDTYQCGQMAGVSWADPYVHDTHGEFYDFLHSSKTACWFVFVTVLFNLMIYLARWYWEKLQHAINAEHHPIIHDTTTAL
ncbi:transmembrane protein 179B-like isoform X2 [Symsagittifera roscoffensis]|uniref:transmembrane protein 179B-like isoform X2 n=1 Tax=Symsagittifera roscoffensis TaxID=84072 RepID=UPI00307B64A4